MYINAKYFIFILVFIYKGGTINNICVNEEKEGVKL